MTPAEEADSGAGSRRQVVVWRSGQSSSAHDSPALGYLSDDVNYSRVLLRSLMRAQFGLSLMCLAFALAITMSFPVVAALVPAVSRASIAGVPLTLVVLGFACYPALFAIGWFYSRHARKLEARFTELVSAPSRPPNV